MLMFVNYKDVSVEARIQNKYAPKRYWDSIAPGRLVPLRGELCLCSDEGVGMYKIGDGKTDFTDLPWLGVGVVNALTHYDFPSTGNPNIIYKAEEEKKIYQWNSISLAYEVISDNRGLDDIKIIYGGNANGTD